MKVLIVSLATTLLLLNCKKNISFPATESAVVNKQLVTIKEDGGNDINLLYDAAGRLLAHTTNDATTYYKPGNAHFTTLLLKESNEKVTYQHAQQDGLGRIIKLRKYNNGLPESSIEFSYNENDQLAKRKINAEGLEQEYIYSYSDGNLVEIKEYENAMLKSIVLIEYYKSQSNSIAVDVFDFKQIGFASDGHFGKVSKNLTKSVAITTPGGQTTIALNYFYKTYSNGHVRSMEVESNNETIKKYNFIFQ